MINIRIARILCPVTPTRSSELVVEAASSLAAVFNAEVRLFHVRRPAHHEGELGGHSEPDDDESGRLMVNLFALTRRVRQRVRTSAAATEGEAATEIVRHAEVASADLIVIGMRRQDGSPSPLIRAVAASAPCPVMAVQVFGDSSEKSETEPIGDILCCVDFEPASLEALDYALALACRTRNRVTVVHVLRERWDGPSRDDQVITEARNAVEARFLELLQAALFEASPGCETLPVVVSGRPGFEIVGLARQTASSLIVMGMEFGRGFTGERGETGAWIMRLAPCPILLVPRRSSRASAADFRRPASSRRLEPIC